VGRERALALLADWTLVAFLVDVPALAALVVMFFFFPDAPLRETGFAAFCLELLLFLARDTTGGLSRKWMGMKIQDSRGRNPGFLRSICRNLPLLVPGWNLYEAWRVFRNGSSPRSLDRPLGLAAREIA
jgi:hypothetical protein